MTDLAAALLRDVARYRLTGYDAGTQPDGAGPYVSHHEVLAALTAALDPALAERVGELLPDLQLAADDGDIDCKEAVSLLSALLTANAALRAERDWWKQDDRAAWDKCEERRIAQEAAEAERDKQAKAHEKEIYVWSENYAALERKLTAAEAREERLRGALELIADTDPDEGTAWFHSVANAAITETATTEERHDG